MSVYASQKIQPAVLSYPIKQYYIGITYIGDGP